MTISFAFGRYKGRAEVAKDGQNLLQACLDKLPKSEVEVSQASIRLKPVSLPDNPPEKESKKIITVVGRPSSPYPVGSRLKIIDGGDETLVKVVGVATMRGSDICRLGANGSNCSATKICNATNKGGVYAAGRKINLCASFTDDEFAYVIIE